MILHTGPEHITKQCTLVQILVYKDTAPNCQMLNLSGTWTFQILNQADSEIVEYWTSQVLKLFISSMLQRSTTDKIITEHAHVPILADGSLEGVGDHPGLERGGGPCSELVSSSFRHRAP
jgi:hypothetical protein